MATIVTHTESGGVYILLGADYGAYKAARPSFFFGNLAPSEEFGENSLVLICDHSGVVGWADSEKIKVISIDGATPADVLGTEKL